MKRWLTATGGTPLPVGGVGSERGVDLRARAFRERAAFGQADKRRTKTESHGQAVLGEQRPQMARKIVVINERRRRVDTGRSDVLSPATLVHPCTGCGYAMATACTGHCARIAA